MGWKNKNKFIRNAKNIASAFEKLLSEHKSLYITKKHRAAEKGRRFKKMRKATILAPINWLKRDFELKGNCNWSGLGHC